MTRFALASLLLLPFAAFATDPLPDGAELGLGSPPRYDVDSTAAISPDGKKIATIPPNSAVHVWDTETGKLLSGTRYGNRPSVFGWSKEGKLRGLFQGYECFLLHEWADDQTAGPDEKTLSELRKESDPLAKRPYLRGKALSADGARVAFLYEVSNRGDSELRLYTPKPGVVCRLADPDLTHQLQGGEWVGFSGDGNTLFVAQRRTVTAFDLTAKKPSEPAWVIDLPMEELKFTELNGQKVAMPGKGQPYAVLSADGKRVVIEFSHSGGVEVWDGPAGKKLHAWEERHQLFGSVDRPLLALSPDGKRLAISSREKTGLVGGVIYDLDTGKEAVKLAAGPNATHWGLKFSPDGKRLYRRYQVWDAETGKDITPGTGHRGQVTSLVVSGDGKVIVSTGQDLTARGWDAKTGQELWRANFPSPVWLGKFDDDTAVATAAHWSHETIEKPLVSLSTGKRSPLPGDMATGKKVKWGYGERVVYPSPLFLTPDGKTVVTLNVESSALELWDWPKGKLRHTTPFSPPEKFRTSQMSTAVTINGGKELLALFVYAEEKPSQGSGPAFRGMVQLERWDLSTGKRLEVTPFPQYTMPRLLADGEKPLLIDEFFVVKEALTGKEVFRLSDEQKKQHQSLAFGQAVLSPDGNTLVVPSDWSDVATVQFIDLKKGKDLGKRTFAEQARASVGFLPDGRLITIGESVLVWKAVK